ncbi:hypothetical protein ACOMHN_043344 [Nucella lapillus]
MLAHHARSFLLANDGDDDKMLVFSTDKNLEILSASRDFYMDGTFSVSPHLFSQLYTLHVMFLGQMIPVVFALLANKAQNTYTRLFDILSHLCHTRNLPLDPRAIHGEAPEIPGVTELCDYMVKTWVDDQRPLFHREVWSHFASLEEESVRTNLESFHSAFAKSFRSPHPNIFSLVTALKKKQKETAIAVHRLNFGQSSTTEKTGIQVEGRPNHANQNATAKWPKRLLNYMDAMGTTVKMQ